MTILLETIRKIVPIKYRQELGLWTAHAASQSLLLYPYFWLLCGTIPKNLTLLPDDDCSVKYKGYDILSPRDGILAFIEVLQDEIYEKVFSPQPGDIVLDIGAYVGMFSTKAAIQVGNNGQVIAIEPSQDNYHYLYKNLTTLHNTTIIRKAVGSYAGICKLYSHGATPCYSLTSISKNHNNDFKEVVIDTLDNIIKSLHINRVDFIKIDAEGAELEILKGAKTLLTKKVKLSIAAYHNLPSGERELPYLVQFLTEHKFETQVVNQYIYAEKKIDD